MPPKNRKLVITDLYVHCEGCGKLEQVTSGPFAGSGWVPKRGAPKTARIVMGSTMHEMGQVYPVISIKCDECGWHEPIESEDFPRLLMEVTGTKNMSELFYWVLAQIVKERGVYR